MSMQRKTPTCLWSFLSQWWWVWWCYICWWRFIGPDFITLLNGRKTKFSDFMHLTLTKCRVTYYRPIWFRQKVILWCSSSFYTASRLDQINRILYQRTEWPWAIMCSRHALVSRNHEQPSSRQELDNRWKVNIQHSYGIYIMEIINLQQNWALVLASKLVFWHSLEMSPIGKKC